MSKSEKVDKNLLDRVRGAKKRLDERTSGGGDINWWKPKDDKKQKVRILPDADGGPYFYVEGWAHWDVGPNDVRVNCPNLTEGVGGECAICEVYEELSKGGDEDKKIAREVRPKAQYYMNIIDRDREDEGIFVWSAPPSVFDIIARDVEDEYYGFWDTEDGNDFYVFKDTSGAFNDYGGCKFSRYDTPLFEDEELIEETMEQINDLLEVISLPSYEETEAALLGEEIEEEDPRPDRGEEPVNEDEEDEEEVKSDVQEKLDKLRGGK